MEQRTAEWRAIRCGKATASRISDALAQTKSGWGAGRANYMAQLVAERLTNECAESFTSAAMQWGTDQEPQARLAYELTTGSDVLEEGFIIHPDIPDAGASPDGLVGDDGMLEIKCPNTATHINTLRTKKIDKKYIIQMQWQLCCANRDWCDFVSYDPRLPAPLNMFKKRVERDGTDELEEQVCVFLAEVAAAVQELRNMM